MSHDHPYRRLLADSDLRPDRRPDPGPYSSSDRPRASQDCDFYRQPQESFSSSSSSSRGAKWSQDGALSILSSCGLEPSDLALLAKLPEDVLTVESLPEVLHQIKGKRGTIKPFPPSAPPPSSFSSSSSSSSYPHSSTRGSTVSPSTTDWDHGHSKPLKSLMDQVIPSPLPSDLDRWGNPRTSTSVRADSASSSSTSGYMVDFHHRSAQPECSRAGRDAGPVLSQDFHHRPGPSEFGKMGRDTGSASSQDFHHRPRPSEYGKTGRDAGRVSSHDFHHQAGSLKYGKTGRDANLASSQERAYFSSSGEGRRTRPSHLSQPGPADYRSAPPPAEVHLRTHLGRREPETSSTTSSSQPTMAMPSEREALDFHGTCPPLFPYSCSLCDITVMSERVWIKHINGTQHADGQLSLLQQFPNWDCRMETVSRANNQSEKPKDEGGPGQQPQTARQSSTSQPSKKPQQKTSEEGKVVCVKFPAQSVDETYLRKLVEPFGKIVKILMFPSLAFVELGSVDQAKDLVKFHVNYPPTVNGEQMEFRISKTFSFLQSSRVVSFTPAPTGDSSQSDLISIIKRFGSPLYILFLPSMAFVEMKNCPDAQKLVDYYSSNTLRINGEILKVSFSGEYKSLMRVASAKRFEEETTKRKRSSSREKDDKSTEEKRKKSSKEEEKEGDRSSREKTRTRSRSREKSSRDRRTKSRSKSREKSKEKSKRSRSRSRDRFGRDRRTRTRSESREKSSRVRKSRSRSRSKGKSGAPEKREPKASESRSDPDPDPDPVRDSKPEAEEREQSAEEAESSAEESDIEGMEVIGEDGENLEDDVEESLDDADVEEENVEEEVQQEEEEAQEKDSCSAKRTDSSKEDAEEVKEGEPEEMKVKEKPVNEKKKEKKEEDEKCGTKSQEEESERTTDPQLEDEEVETRLTQEEPDFPVDLENCITLDELEEEEEGDEEVQREPESPSTRVISFRNLPLRSYTDAQFIRLVKDFGTAVRYFHKPPSCGFIEMSTSSEALRAVKELRRKPVIFNGSKLVIQMSNKYRRLTDGWEVQFDEDSDKEKRSERSQSSRRSTRKNKDESDRKAEGKRELSKKTPEEESKSKSASKISSQKESVSRNTLESVEKESENESKSEKTSDKDEDSEESESRRTSGKESCETLEKNCRKTAEEESTSEQTEAENVSPANKLSENKSLPRSSREKETHEKHSVSEEKKELVNDEGQRKQELVATEAPEGEKVKEKGSEEDTCGPGLKDAESPDQPAAPKPQTEQKPADDDSLRDSSRSGPAEGATELQKHTKPVGTEFVRPVVGYFCNLCQLIYADEDEAKLQHCSSLTHYRKYQEKTGKDPWAS